MGHQAGRIAKECQDFRRAGRFSDRNWPILL